MNIRYPFEVTFQEILNDPDVFVSAVFSCLESEFLFMPKGGGFVEFREFDRGYEALKLGTSSFSRVSVATLSPVVRDCPIAVVVLRAMLGFTPPEWAYIATQRTGVEVTQGFARSLDRRVRLAPFTPLTPSVAGGSRLRALLDAGCQLLVEGAPDAPDDRLHRLNKADTVFALRTIQSAAQLGVPYSMVLYERFLGRPFAGHRDSVSELIGDILESAIETVLNVAGITYRKTKRAEVVPGFDQAPDFIIPSEFNPQVIIEAKLSEDDGTARDKVTRIQHLGELSMAGRPPDDPRYEVVACIGGRGFAVRKADMRKTLLATRGKVFTLRTLDRLVQCTRLRDFRTK